MYNLTYKTPYHDGIRQKLKQYPGHHWEPQGYGRDTPRVYHPMHSSPWQYVPSRDDDEDRHDVIRERFVEEAEAEAEAEGGFSFRPVKKIVKKGEEVAKTVGSAALSIGLDVAFDEGIKAAAIAAGAEVGVPPFISAAIGKAVGKFARKEIKEKTGFARGVGTYEPEGGISLRKIKKATKKAAKKAAEDYGKKALSLGADVLLKDALPEVTGYLGEQAGVPKNISKAVGKKTGTRLRKTLKEKTGIARKNPWVSHVKQYAADHNMTYGGAMKDPKCKESY